MSKEDVIGKPYVWNVSEAEADLMRFPCGNFSA